MKIFLSILALLCSLLFASAYGEVDGMGDFSLTIFDERPAMSPSPAPHVPKVPLPRDVLDDMNLLLNWTHRESAIPPPIALNNFLMPGYLNMPSARMLGAGFIGAGASDTPPYTNINVLLQPFSRLQVSGSFRIFRGVLDRNLSPVGYGDYADRGMNAKFALLLPEDSGNSLPGISIGGEDLIGTGLFHSKYVIATQVIPAVNMEFSLGYGAGRIKGLFGGVAWSPFAHKKRWPIKNLTFTAEYDAIDYESSDAEPHPSARTFDNRVNIGVQYRFFNMFSVGVGYIKGQDVSMMAGATYNFGETEGLIPKIEDPLPYNAPKITESLGVVRTETMFSHDIAHALKQQGFNLLSVVITDSTKEGVSLVITIDNQTYRYERIARMRVEHILANLLPQNVISIIVVFESEGIACQQYAYRGKEIHRYGSKELGTYELQTLSPIQEITFPDKARSKEVYKSDKSPWSFNFQPRVHTYFNSPQGKLQYAMGVALGVQGYFGNNIFYEVEGVYSFYTTFSSKADSPGIIGKNLLRVYSDYDIYLRNRALNLDIAYLQKGWALGNGFSFRVASGYFGPVFGGGAVEALFYPVNSLIGVGVNAAVLWKRDYYGFGFQRELHYSNGQELFLQRYSYLKQYFVDFYYDIEPISIKTKVSVGRFLAGDYGARVDVTRYFPSGLEISLWYTMTNAKETINGSLYYDNGVAFRVPLDLLYEFSARSHVGFAISAWTRDTGRRSETGKSLYDILSAERR